jgi:hypothetical protein
MPFVSSTLKSFEKWWSPLSGVTGNFNHQILPYGILFLTFISTNVFYLLSFKIHSRIYPARDVVQSIWYNISALIRCNFIIKNYVNHKITSYIFIFWYLQYHYGFMSSILLLQCLQLCIVLIFSLKFPSHVTFS